MDMRNSELLLPVLLAVMLMGLTAVGACAGEPNIYEWWLDEFGSDPTWATEELWVQNYVLNSQNGTWRASEYQDPDESGSGYDLTSYIWVDGWENKEVRLEVEHAGWRWGNTFGIYDISDAAESGSDPWTAGVYYTLFDGSDSAGATAATYMDVPDGQFVFWLDSRTPGGDNGGRWVTDPSMNSPNLDCRCEPDNISSETGGSGDVDPPFMQCVVLEHPTAEFGGWILAWADADVSQGEHMFGWHWAGGCCASEPDYNDMIVSMQKTPELPPSALLGLSMLPLGIAYLRGRRRKES